MYAWPRKEHRNTRNTPAFERGRDTDRTIMHTSSRLTWRYARMYARGTQQQYNQTGAEPVPQSYVKQNMTLSAPLLFEKRAGGCSARGSQ